MPSQYASLPVMKIHHKGKVARKKPSASNRRVETTINIKTTKEKKERFLKALMVGRKTSITDALEAFMEAYCEMTEKEKRQPEFPLEVRSKPPAQS